MPPKNKSAGSQQQKAASTDPTSGGGMSLIQEGGDPVASAISIIDKKVRNLEKRKNKLVSLKENAPDVLDKGQQEAITKIKDVELQLELVKDLQKQFSALQVDYQKYSKRQQRQERQQAKEAERKAEGKAVAYTLRVQDILNSMGDEDKENFRTEKEGAVKLSDDELGQLDELYKVLNPRREENQNYDSEVSAASEHVLLLLEESPKEIAGTTYKDLHDVFERIEESGYFSQPGRGGQEEQDSEEDGDEYKSAEDQVNPLENGVPSNGTSFTTTEEVDIAPEVPPEVEAGPPTPQPPQQFPEEGSTLAGGMAPAESSIPIEQGLLTSGGVPMISQASNIINYNNMPPSAPSPTFPGLGTSPVLLSHDSGFSFMHESEVDRKHQAHPLPSSPLSTSQQSTQQAPPSQTQSHQAPPPQAQAPPPQVQSHPVAPQNVDYGQYNNQGGVVTGNVVPPTGKMEIITGVPNAGGQSTTDVTTGQPSPSLQPSYQQQSTVPMATTTTGILVPTATTTPTHHDIPNVDMMMGGGVIPAGMGVAPAGMGVASVPGLGGSLVGGNVMVMPQPDVVQVAQIQHQQQQQQHQQQQQMNTGFRQPHHQQTQQQPYYRGSSQNKGMRGPPPQQGGGGGRRPGGPLNKGNYGNSNNNRNGGGGRMPGGYESHGQVYSSGPRGYGGGGGGYQQVPQQQRGGRPNYRTNSGGGPRPRN